ncbi:VanZ family protein [Bacillus spizizenii]|nr:VanZ family protein [Bacillus spizizenii]
MNIIFDFTYLWIMLSLLYFIYDLIKNRKKTRFVRKLIFISFLLYLCIVYHVVLGQVYLIPEKEFSQISIQLIPFAYLFEWVQLYNMSGLTWELINSVKLTFYNLLLLFPFGLYISLLWRNVGLKKLTILSFSTSLLIETLQLILSASGMIMVRTFNIDDLILNTLGSMFGFYIGKNVTYRIRKKYTTL